MNRPPTPGSRARRAPQMRGFRSKVNFLPLLVTVLALFLLDAAAMGISLPAMTGLSPLGPFAVFLVAALLPVLLVLVFFPVRYHLSSRELRVRSGLLRWHIPIADIHRARTQRSVRPAPALSTERIRLDYQSGARVRSLRISPVDPRQFLNELVSRDRGLVLDDGEVLRRSGPIVLLANVSPDTQ